MSRWLAVGRVEDCPPGALFECVVEETVVALFNVAGEYHALDGVCPHQGGPLGKGQLSGKCVTCPWHGWQFDVCTGQHALNVRIVQPRFAVRVEDGVILVELPEP